MIIDEKHIFSFYYTPQEEKEIFIIPSKNFFYNRIAVVLRMKLNDKYICFDNNYIYDVVIISITKKNIINKILQKKENRKNKKKIIAYIPYLERDYMNEVFYILGQQGIDEVQLVKTELSQVREYTEKDYIRFEKLIIQGCEQGRQYQIPIFNKKNISIRDLILKEERLFWFYEQGDSLLSVLLENKLLLEYAFLCGPERGYSTNEINMLKENLSFQAIRLSNFILRSVDVINFASVVLRSI